MIIPTETLKKGMTDIENVGYERDEVPKKIAAISQLKSKFLRVKVPESSGPRRAEMTSEEELNVERGDGREGSCCSQRASEADRVSCPRRFPPYLPLSAGLARRVSLDSAPFSDPLRNCGSVGQLVRRSL